MDEATPRVEELLAELRERVAQRRRTGEYPPGLEDELDGHYRRLIGHRERRTYADLHAALDRLAAAVDVGRHRIAEASDVPGGAALHRAVSRATARQTEGILRQVAELGRAVEDLARLVVAQLEDPAEHAHLDLYGPVDALAGRVAALERAAAPPSAAWPAVEERLRRLERAEASRSVDPWFGNHRFEQRFRGTREELLDRYRDLAERLRHHQPVLDLGCGRGELLELLAEAGVEGWGVEVDPELVAEGQRRGLDVRLGEGMSTLDDLPQASLGALVLLQVIEHLPPRDATDLPRFAAAKVRPGGVAIVESVNPQSLYTYAHAFYLDPTHTRPVHPEYVRFLFEEAGFAQVDVEWRTPCPPEDVLDPQPTGSPEVDAVLRAYADRLNRLLFGAQDYAVVATR